MDQGISLRAHTFVYVLYIFQSGTSGLWCFSCSDNCVPGSICWTNGKCFSKKQSNVYTYGCMHTWALPSIDYQYNGCSNHLPNSADIVDGGIWCFCDKNFCNRNTALFKFFTSSTGTPATTTPSTTPIHQGSTLHIAPTQTNSVLGTSTYRPFRGFQTGGTSLSFGIGRAKDLDGQSMPSDLEEPLEVVIGKTNMFDTRDLSSGKTDRDPSEIRGEIPPGKLSTEDPSYGRAKYSIVDVDALVSRRNISTISGSARLGDGNYDMFNVTGCGIVYGARKNISLDALENDPCPPDFEYHQREQSCYKIERLAKNHSDAEKHCQQLHQQAHLIILETHTEYDCVANRLHEFSELHNGWQGWWISGHYDESLREFVTWSSDVISRRDRRWLTSLLRQPYVDTCVWMVPQARMFYGNYACSQKSGFICEIRL